uniref:Uncharacterized protein n=1 Tax=Nelumbo nucifera TaxID=4432 RepID=A0A822XYB2_NELNU|nr:TPA_asm: hypothetical protein HUJ06_026761 [Nelumbo nucifera]
MAFNQTTILLITLAIIFAIVASTSGGGVEAGRVLSGDSARANHLVAYPSVYDKASSAVLCWLGRLSSGQSPDGPGH